MNRPIIPKKGTRTEKTVLCTLHTVGKCLKMNKTCPYAHGMEELRPTNWDTPGVQKNSKGYFEYAYTVSRR